jgi:hypothetical protein
MEKYLLTRLLDTIRRSGEFLNRRNLNLSGLEPALSVSNTMRCSYGFGLLGIGHWSPLIHEITALSGLHTGCVCTVGKLLFFRNPFNSKSNELHNYWEADLNKAPQLIILNEQPRVPNKRAKYSHT